MHRAAAEKMQVDVKDGLACALVSVEERTVSDFRKASLLRDKRGAADQLADDLIVFRPDVVERWDVTLRDDQHMCRRLRVDVIEGDDPLVLIYDRRRYLSLDDLAEQAVGHGA